MNAPSDFPLPWKVVYHPLPERTVAYVADANGVAVTTWMPKALAERIMRGVNSEARSKAALQPFVALARIVLGEAPLSAEYCILFTSASGEEARVSLEQMRALAALAPSTPDEGAE